MDINRFLKELKRELVCDGCGRSLNIKSNFSVSLENDVIYKTCECGTVHEIDGRISIRGYSSTRSGKNVTYQVEVQIDGSLITKYLPGDELKKRAGAIRISQLDKMELYLNSKEGRIWAIENAEDLLAV